MIHLLLCLNITLASMKQSVTAQRSVGLFGKDAVPAQQSMQRLRMFITLVANQHFVTCVFSCCVGFGRSRMVTAFHRLTVWPHMRVSDDNAGHEEPLIAALYNNTFQVVCYSAHLSRVWFPMP